VADITRIRPVDEQYYTAMVELVERLEKGPDAATRRIAQRGRVHLLLWAGRRSSRTTNYREAARHYDQAAGMATAQNDSAAMTLHAMEMSDLYLRMGDTTNAVRFGHTAAKSALAYGDSLFAAQILLRTSRMDTSKARMRQALAFTDPYYRPDRPGRDYYLWTRAWTLTAHGEHDQAIADLLVADSLLTGKDDALRALVNWTLGESYQRAGRSPEAIAALRSCITLATAHGNAAFHSGCARAMGDEQFKLGNLGAVEAAWKDALETGHQAALPTYEMPALAGLGKLYAQQGRFEEALSATARWAVLRDSMARMDATHDLLRSEFRAEQRADSLLSVRQQEAAAHQLHRERTRRNLVLACAALAVIFGFFSYRQRRRTQAALKRSDELLLNILPQEVADELKVKGEAEARHFASATVLFTDFKDFTRLSEQVSPAALVAELNTCFKAFDGIVEKYRIEKIKTIGDAYMAVGGVPDPQYGPPADVVRAALEMQDFMQRHSAGQEARGLPRFGMRVGIHTGAVVAGIVGVRKFQYDVWGDAVNTANRIESSGEVGQVNISGATYALVRDTVVGSQLSVVSGDGGSRTTDNQQLTTKKAFIFTPRGKVGTKGKGEMEMYFVHWSAEDA